MAETPQFFPLERARRLRAVFESQGRKYLPGADVRAAMAVHARMRAFQHYGDFARANHIITRSLKRSQLNA